MRKQFNLDKASLPKISVIVSIPPCAGTLPVLTTLKNIDYPMEKIEILLGVGRCPPAQRNRAAMVAKGDILFFFNHNSRPKSDIFKIVADIFRNKKNIVAAGGPDLIPPDNSYVQHLFAYAMSSYFAHWRMKARYSCVGKERPSDEKELLLSNLAIKREVYLKANGFDERLYPNEENELLNRMQKLGYAAYYSPDIVVYRDKRKNLSEFMHQFIRYGKGRMNQVFLQGFVGNMPFFLPSLLLAYLLSLPIVLLFFRNSSYFLLPAAIYATIAFIDALIVSFRNKKRSALLFLPFIYLLMHLSYGWGFLYNLVMKTLGLKKNNISCSIEVLRLKELGTNGWGADVLEIIMRQESKHRELKDIDYYCTEDRGVIAIPRHKEKIY